MRSIWSWCRQLNKQRWTYCLFTGDVSFTSVADIRYIIHTDNIEPSLNQFSITLYYRLGGGGGLRIPYGASGLLDETGMCETPPLLRIRKCSSISVKNKGYSLSFYRGGLQSVFYVVPYTVVIFGCRICYSPPFFYILTPYYLYTVKSYSRISSNLSPMMLKSSSSILQPSFFIASNFSIIIRVFFKNAKLFSLRPSSFS